jgi:hypothetical protein
MTTDIALIVITSLLIIMAVCFFIKLLYANKIKISYSKKKGIELEIISGS